MNVIRSIEKMKALSFGLKQSGGSIGFVPTMGYLHEGHLSLVRASRRENAKTIVSIFVNPAQFGPNMDLDKYPRDLERDLSLLKAEGVDAVFVPETADIYPSRYNTWVEVNELTELLDGASRPGYFRGICTVVLKLINIVGPDRAYFGQKDVQQAQVIQKMIQDLHLDVKLSMLPIVREANGLAMSSRNAYLNAEERERASVLYKALTQAEKLFAAGERNAATLCGRVRDILKQEPLIAIDYVDAVSLASMRRIATIKEPCCLALAVAFKGTRLIDNIILNARL